MDKRGNVFLVFGKRGTGKSFEAKILAEFFRNRTKAPKRVIILDWSNNEDTYGEIRLIHQNDLRKAALPKDALVRVQCNWSEFLDCIENVVNAVIIIDDATSLFKGNVPDKLQRFFGTAKNKRLEIMLQVHSISDASPTLLRESNVWILKQTLDPSPLKDTCRSRIMVENILREIKSENAFYGSDQKWATRMVDWDEEKVFIKDLDNQTEHLGYLSYKEFEEYI